LAKENWLTLMEYSSQHNVSISTLRRKIKSNDLTFQFTDGKYFILDDSLPTQKQASGPETIVPPKGSATQDQEPKAPSSQGSDSSETTKLLLQEIKKAYSMVLQEKEEQILQLKEEVSDLQTLVRVLENEVQRQKTVIEASAKPVAPTATKSASPQPSPQPQQSSVKNPESLSSRMAAEQPAAAAAAPMRSSSSLSALDFDLELDQF